MIFTATTYSSSAKTTLTAKSIEEKVTEIYENWPTSEGWYQHHRSENLIDMCFRISDERDPTAKVSNEFHCYLTLHLDTMTFNGNFGYWTPEDGLPTIESVGKFDNLIELHKLETVKSFQTVL